MLHSEPVPHAARASVRAATWMKADAAFDTGSGSGSSQQPPSHDGGCSADSGANGGGGGNGGGNGGGLSPRSLPPYQPPPPPPAYNHHRYGDRQSSYNPWLVRVRRHGYKKNAMFSFLFQNASSLLRRQNFLPIRNKSVAANSTSSAASQLARVATVDTNGITVNLSSEKLKNV